MLANFFRTSEVRKMKEKMRKGYITMESQKKKLAFLQKAFLLQHVAGGVGGLFEQDRPVLQSRCRRSDRGPKLQGNESGVSGAATGQLRPRLSSAPRSARQLRCSLQTWRNWSDPGSRISFSRRGTQRRFGKRPRPAAPFRETAAAGE